MKDDQTQFRTAGLTNASSVATASQHETRESLRAETERLRAALLTVRQAIMEGNPEAIIDTVWVSDIETAVDFIDTALETPA